ncbi:MAG: CHAT domain-containing tetratricopeptide repeat protein [Terriglobales bacterium]
MAAASEAEKGYKDFHTAGPEWAWKFTILRARVLHLRGMDDEALKLLSSEPTPPPSGELAVQKLRWEGLAYASLHKFTEADEAFRKAEQLCTVVHYPVCADVVGAQGVLEMDRGRYAQAQSLFENVLVAARSSGDQFWEANALLDLSWSADEQAHLDQALDWADAARRISVAKGYDDIAQTALGNMGWAYYKLGDPEKAEGMFVEARKQAEKLGDTTDRVTWLQALGYIYLDAHKFAAAQESYRQALDLAQHTNREDIIDSLIALAFVSEQTNKLDDAKRYADEALAKAREDNNGRDQVYPRLVQGRVAARLHDIANAESAFREVAQSPDCPVFLKWEAERSLARLYEDESQFDSAEHEYRTALNTFETARSELKHEDSRLPFLTNASRIYDDYIHFLVARGKATEALQVADFSRGRTLALGVLQKETSFPPGRMDAQAIARRAGGTILFYWLGEQRSYLWAITPKKIRLFALPAAAEIETAVERYRRALDSPQDILDSASDTGSLLYRMLIAPAQELLSANARVIIIPDGKLNNLNFETLLVPNPVVHYWIEDVTITNASSLRLLGSPHTDKKRGRNLLLFGNAVAPSPEYPELADAAVEMTSVAKHFPMAQQRLFQRDQATPAAYLSSHPEQFSYIHFVAHGMASRLSPLDSAIVLSKANGENQNFKLYARDIIQHPVRAELVTISACYGAGTRAYSGEGLVGLSWAFLRAGAHGVVAALWQASDVSTGQLMDKFYEQLNKGDSPDTALRAAKLSLLHSGGAFRKPFYWAPFQFYTGS